MSVRLHVLVHLLDITEDDQCYCSFGEGIDHGRHSRGSDGGNSRGVRGGWFINGIIGLLWADDGLCYVSNDEGAKIIAVEVLESTAVSQKGGLAAEWREARAMTIHNVARAARSFLVAASC